MNGDRISCLMIDSDSCNGHSFYSSFSLKYELLFLCSIVQTMEVYQPLSSEKLNGVIISINNSLPLHH
jgi:hypothetical protein